MISIISNIYIYKYMLFFINYNIRILDMIHRTIFVLPDTRCFYISVFACSHIPSTTINNTTLAPHLASRLPFTWDIYLNLKIILDSNESLPFRFFCLYYDLKYEIFNRCVCSFKNSLEFYNTVLTLKGETLRLSTV